MKQLSTQEFEALGASLFKIITEKKEDLGLSFDEKKIDDMVEKAVRNILKKTQNRQHPYSDIDPQDFLVIQKRLEEKAGTDEVTKKLHEMNDDLYILCTIMKRQPSALQSFPNFERKWGELVKALNTSAAGVGLEWIPEGFSQSMIDLVEIEAKITSLFQSFTMPTNPYTFPVKSSHLTAYKGGEATTDSPSMYKTSSMGTDDLTFTAIKSIVNTAVSDEMIEDAYVAVLPELRRDIAIAQSRGSDNAIINGDTTATHLDTGYTVASDDIRRSWNGLRDMCISTLKNDGSTWSTSAGLALLRGLNSEMGLYGINPDEIKVLCNTNMYQKMMSLAEVRTVDKFGAVATIKNGRLNAIDGEQIVLTQHVEELQNASGVYDGTTETLTQLLKVWTPGFRVGIRKGFTIEYVRKPLYGNSYLVSTMRKHFRAIRDTTTEPMIGWLYNVTK